MSESEPNYDYFGITDMISDAPDPSIMTVFQHDNYLAVRVVVPTNEAEKSIHLGLLIDVSDSMSDGRLDAVKKTLHAARHSFQQNDRVTLVIFGETSQSVVVNHRMDEAGKVAFYAALDAVQTGGCTNMGAGFETLHAVQPSENRYDTVIILTDGEVNRGILTTEGLTTMAFSIGDEKGLTFHTLGYGADHNRALLRVLSTQTCGIYQYIQSAEQVSSTFGDSIGNTRAVVIRNASLHLSDRWKCLEVSPSLGDIVPERECWAVYQRKTDLTDLADSADLTVRLQGWTRNGLMTIVKNSAETSDLVNTKVQILRARVSCALTDLSNILESRRVIRRRVAMDQIDTARSHLEELRDELNAIPTYSAMWLHPLILHMKAQIAEALVPTDPFDMEDSLARLSSGAAALSTQRAASDPHNVDSALFTSPAGRSASSRVHDRYHR